MENAISKFLIWGVEIWGGNAISNVEFGGWKIWVENAISNLQFGWVENLGWIMLSRISNLGCGKFGVENAVSNLEFGVWKIWGGKCYLESPIWVGWKIWGG